MKPHAAATSSGAVLSTATSMELLQDEGDMQVGGCSAQAPGRGWGRGEEGVWCMVKRGWGMRRGADNIKRAFIAWSTHFLIHSDLQVASNPRCGPNLLSDGRPMTAFHMLHPSTPSTLP
jgi:hypothetical protein